ncbi:MAG: hypothetical protein WBD40_19415 [Tepidisphaeraceae bacterium]
MSTENPKRPSLFDWKHDVPALLLFALMAYWADGYNFPSFSDTYLLGKNARGFQNEQLARYRHWYFWSHFLTQGPNPYRVTFGGEWGPFAATIASNGMEKRWVVRFPFWIVPATCAIPLLISISHLRSTFRGWARWIASFRHRNEGRCAKCGYDLRASPERCPECGEPTKHAYRCV